MCRKALRRLLVRRLQGLLPPQRAQEARLLVPLQPRLRGGQGQAEPVPVLQAEEVLQGRDEEGRRPEREGQNQLEEAKHGGHDHVFGLK